MEWCTNRENILHAFRNGLCIRTDKQRKTSVINGKKSAIQVDQFDKQGNFIKTWESASEVERQLNIPQRCICTCCKGKQKTSGGFIWKYTKTIS